MAFYIGTDEAGYGPNLGPLTITGTLWQVPEPDIELYPLLEEVVSDRIIEGRLAIADSKALYQSTGTIKALETSVLAVLYAQTDQMPSDWRKLMQIACSEDHLECEAESWIAGQQLTLPLAADIEAIKELGQRFRIACGKAEVELLRINCCPIFPSNFNRGIDEYGNKASLLSSVTMSLASELKAFAFGHDTDSCLKIVCDKHGGRSRYAGLCSEFLTEEFIWVKEEGIDISAYRWSENSRDVSASFVARGESFLPTALASMVSKYVREVFMELWNRFWRLKVPNLKPTKGYPLDAKRFKREIASVQETLGIADESIWRKR